MSKPKSASRLTGASFQLTKVSALMASAALLTLLPAHQVLAQAQGSQVVLVPQLTGNIDGKEGAGFLITGDERFGGNANVTVGNVSGQSLVHSFNTVGGAGSGGGAGLGGAFFVDTGATLTVINTDFKSNRVQGGAGGSAPALLYYDRSLTVTGASVDLPSYIVTADVAGGITPMLSYADGKYSFNYLSVARETASLIKKDTTAIFESYGVTTKIANVSADTVLFASPVQATAVNVPKFVDNVSSGFVSTANGSVTVGYKLTPVVEGETTYNQVTDIPNLSGVSIGAKLVASTDVSRTGLQVATVTGVEYFTQEDDDFYQANGKLRGKVKSINLDKTISGTIASVDVIKAPTFKATQFATSEGGTKVSIAGTLGTFTQGMTVSWEEGSTTKTAKVLAVDGRTLTLDAPIPAGVTDIKAVENPLVGDNKISVPNATTKFTVGQTIYVPGQDKQVFEGTVAGIDGSVVTVTPKDSSAKLADYYDPALGLSLKLSAAQVGGEGSTITVPYNTAGKTEASIRAQLIGRLVEGASFEGGTTISGVTVKNGAVTLTLSAPVKSESVEFFKLYSPLKVGGSMNNIGVPSAIANQSPQNGSNGYSANFVNTFFNDSEGVDGTNGAPAGDNLGGKGFNGGDGGNGSNGWPVNFFLIYDLASAIASVKTASIDVGAAAAEMAEALTPDPVVGAAVELPDPLKIAAASLNVTKANIDMGFAIADTVLATTNLAKWAVELSRGLAGLGGAGGDGGQGSGGADFFGGGAGGAGGAGGDGAISISDGGDGGAGGQGGAGGFGAGGGQGGAGGAAGANGNAASGDPGDGGFAGFGAGDGANGDGLFGGGGSGLGGSIFVRAGGSLVIAGNAHFERNRAAGGSTTSQFGEAGSGEGTDLFIMKGANVRLDPGIGKVIRFDGSIADDSLATNDGYQNAAGDGADIRIGGVGGGGLVEFAGENTYSGHTILEGATLSAKLGTGVNDASLIRFNGAGSIAPDLMNNKVASTLSLNSVGTFLLQEDYDRRVGMDTAETAWTGSGGFASGLTTGVKVNLGALDDERAGQQLEWGKDGFFVAHDSGAATAGVLTFGSEQAKGAVEFTNNVDLNNKIGRVAVYNNGNLNTSSATLSGSWGNALGDASMLVVGDSSKGSAYNGYLFMTGQNSLDSVVVAGGVLSTFNADPEGQAGKLMKSSGDLIVLADKDNEGAVSRLDLFSAESVRDVSVLQGGALTLAHKLSASGDLLNRGLLSVLGENTAKLSEEAAAQLKPIYVPLDHDQWQGELDLTGKFTNQGTVAQAANAKVGSLQNHGAWMALGNTEVVHDFGNSAKAVFNAAGDTTVGGALLNDGLIDLVGKLSVKGDAQNNAGASLTVTGDTSAGALVNAGVAEVVGKLAVAGSAKNDVGASLKVQGDTTVGGGVINMGTARLVGAVSVEEGVQNDKDASLAIEGDATVGASVVNHGIAQLTGNVLVGRDVINGSNAAMTLKGDTTVGGVVGNSGYLQQTGDMNVSGAVNNQGYWRFGQDAQIKANALSGDGVFCLSDTKTEGCTGGEAKRLALELASDSTFGGVFTGKGGLQKQGTATLTLTEAQTFTGDLTVSGGTLQTAERATLNDSVNVTVGSAGTYVVGVADTVKRVTNNGQKGGAVLNADLTATDGFVNNGRLLADSDLGAIRHLNLGKSGLSGSADGLLEITQGTTFVLKQDGNSAYEGQIQALGDRSPALVKDGTGTLTLSNTVDVKNILVSQGEVALNKANILSRDAAVTIAGAGKLSLVTGDQAIEKLLGAGVINLGSNTLRVEDGGGFDGEVFGSGSIVVDSGEFAINGTINSAQASFVVNDSSTTVVGGEGLLQAQQVDVKAGGRLKLGRNSADRGGLLQTAGLGISGVLEGSGTVAGAATVRVGGHLNPGYSPGQLVFTDGLSLQSDSLVTMEIADPDGAPGVGFDQIVIAGPFHIDRGAVLRISDLGSRQLTMGETVNIFQFELGQVGGAFGDVSTNVPGAGALSLATGNVVGFGDKVLADVAASATTANEKAIYNGLLQASTGGVAQFYGGNFIERLTAAIGSGASTKTLYNAYNPESYLSLSDVSQAAANEALPVWKAPYENQDKLFAHASRTTYANAKDTAHQAYGLGLRSYAVGASRRVGDHTVLMTFGAVDGSTSSHYVNASGKGFNAGVSLLGAVNGWANTSWFVGLSHANLKMDGTRWAGGARFEDVGSSATQLQAGLEKSYAFSSGYLKTRAALSLGSASRDRVNEIGVSSALNTMAVHADRHRYTLLDLGVEMGRQVSASTHWYGSAHYQSGKLNQSTITAGFDNDQARVTVAGKSALSSNLRLMTGLRHQYSPDTSIDASIGVARGWDRSSDIQVRVGLTKSF